MTRKIRTPKIIAPAAPEITPDLLSDLTDPDDLMSAAVSPDLAADLAPVDAPPDVIADAAPVDAVPNGNLPPTMRTARETLATPDAARDLPADLAPVMFNGAPVNMTPGATPMFRALSSLDRAPCTTGGDPAHTPANVRAALTLAAALLDGATTTHADAISHAARIAHYGPRGLHDTTGVSDLTLRNLATRGAMRLLRFASGASYRATPGRLDRTDDAATMLAHTRARVAAALAALPPV